MAQWQSAMAGSNSSPSSPSPPSPSSPSVFSSWFSFFDCILEYARLLLLIITRRLLKAVKHTCLEWFLAPLGFVFCQPSHSQVQEEDEKNQLLVEESKDNLSLLTLLPPSRLPENDNKLTVVLDLDETLVCAYSSNVVPSDLQMKAQQGGLNWFTLQWTASNWGSSSSPRVSNVTVYERPGLAEFLEQTSKFAEIVLFTAGLEAYARPLIDHIDPHGRIAYRLYRPSTVSTSLREHVKDLSSLGRDLRRVVIIDNNPFSFLLQPLNGVPCVPFTGHHTQDHQLLKVLLPLLEQLSQQPDVRPYLLRRFHMPTWFRSRGVPATDFP